MGTDPNQPGNRPAFVYNLAPGATQNDALTVWNYGDVQLTFHVYPTDAFNTKDGGFTLLTAEEKPKDVGAWIALQQNSITLPPHTKAKINLTVTVPANATPGDHAAGIVAESQTESSNEEGKHVLLDRRVGSRVYLRVSGPTNPALTVEHLSSDYHAAVNPLDGTLDVTYTVRNAGNVRLGGRQTVTVKDLFGTVTQRHPAELSEILPGNAVTVTQHFTGVAATVRVGADVKVTPFIPKASGSPVKGRLVAATASSKTWAIPWLLVVLLLVMVALIVYSRRRRHAGPAPSDGATDPGAGGGGPTLDGDPGAAPSDPVGATLQSSSQGPGDPWPP